MKKLFTLALLLTSLSALAEKTCYQVSDREDVWSRSPQLICVEKIVEDDFDNTEHRITIEQSNMLGNEILKSVELELLERARCMDCNHDAYGLEGQVVVRFNGQRNMASGEESGTVSILSQKQFYRSLPQ